MKIKECNVCHELKPHASKGLCATCYQRWRRSREIICVKCNTRTKHFAKNMCQSCYRQSNSSPRTRTCKKCSEVKYIYRDGLCVDCYRYHNKKLVVCKECRKLKPNYGCGLCGTCHNRKLKSIKKTCSECGQKKKIHARGLCSKCYYRINPQKRKRITCKKCGTTGCYAGLCKDCREKERESRIIVCKICGKEKSCRSGNICSACFNKRRKCKIDVCKKCHERKKILARGLCKNCYNIIYIRGQRLRNDYGISLQKYDKMLESQEWGCWICGTTTEESEKNLCVDHDHDTGEIRGILCTRCNSALGFFQDDLGLVLRAVDYLLGNEWSK